MAKPAFRAHRGSTSSKSTRTFETIIYPQEGKVQVCPIFFKEHFQKIKRQDYGYVIDKIGRNSRITFGRTENDNYILSGRSIANDFALYKPTAITLTYLGKSNRFRMKILPKRVRGRWEEDVKEEVISIAYDVNEDINPYGALKKLNVDLEECLHWKMDVTKAIARKNKPQVMHFPNRVSYHIIRDQQKTLMLRDVQTQNQYKCQLITSNRVNNEKYLGVEWYQFVKDRKLKEGDLLVFEFEEAPKKLTVEVVRRSERRS